METKKLKIYACHNNTGSRYYRLIPQLKHMQSKGHEVILEPHTDPKMQEHIEWADIVIFQMVFSYQLVDYCKKLGKKVVFECDDLAHVVPPTHHAYNETKGIKNRLTWWYRIWRTFRNCDGFISTNEGLDKAYGRFAKKRLVFDNYCFIPHWLKEYKPNTGEEVRLLWAGSTSHNGDLAQFKPIMKRILDKYPQVKFIYVGMGGVKTDDLQAKFLYGDDFWEGLPDNRENILAVPGNIWPYKLAALQADLAVAPLNQDYFNGFKSQCKWLEYSINKIPAVYSGWFYDHVLNRHTGLLAVTPDDWFTGISYLIEHPEERKRIGENAYNTVMKHWNMSDHVEEWERFILSI